MTAGRSPRPRMVGAAGSRLPADLVRPLSVLGSLALSVALFAGCNLRDAFSAHVEVVARAGEQELTVDRLGEVIAQGRSVPLRRDVVERMARLWVDYSLFAQRIAEGDSLLDSLSVLTAMWSEAQQQVVTSYHNQLVSRRVMLGGTVVDSAYHAGDHRLVYHILVRTSPDMSPADKEAKKRQVERLRQRAVARRGGWERANQENEDSLAKEVNGSLGLIARGGTVPAFERAAFSLAPGAISPVTESGYGYHIIRRPTLADARAEFESALRDILIERMNYVFLQELEERWEIEVRSSAPRLMREAAEDLLRAKRSRKTIGTYLLGSFTVADFARWLQALPVEYTAQVFNADDEQLEQFVRGLIRNNVLEMEARDAGHRLSEADYDVLRATFSQDLSRLRRAMALDSALTMSANVAETVAEYLAAVATDVAQLVIVPPFLAEKLRQEADWEISVSGVNRALDRGAQRRASLERVNGEQPDDTTSAAPDSARR